MLRSRQAWAEYLWTRLRRMDYWNAKYAADGFLTNAPAKMYRWNAPGLRVGRPEAIMSKLDDKTGTSVFSVRYFHRDQVKRDTGYYPDTPLSLNHSLMKGQPLRAAAGPPDSAPLAGAFGSKSFGTMNAMGMKKMSEWKDEKAASLF